MTFLLTLSSNQVVKCDRVTLTRLDKLSVVDRGSQFVPVSFQVCLWDQQRGIAVREDGIDGHIGHGVGVNVAPDNGLGVNVAPGVWPTLNLD
jgi:hypothetical protein